MVKNTKHPFILLRQFYTLFTRKARKILIFLLKKVDIFKLLAEKNIGACFSLRI